QREVVRVELAIGDVAVAARTGRRRFADDRAVLDSPELRVAVPAVQRFAVEDRDVALVIVEVVRARFGEAHAASTLRSPGGLSGRWLRAQFKSDGECGGDR